MSTRRLGQLKVGSDGPAFRVGPITRTDIVRYAGASGDFNPMHIDLEYAREHGVHDVFAQGQFTGGILARLAVDWFGLGNIRSFRLRFVARVWPGDVIVARGRIISITTSSDGRMVECEIEAVRERERESEVVVRGAVSANIRNM